MCKLCASQGKTTLYYGESGFSSFTRGKNHLDGLKNCNPENVLFQHERECHSTKRMGLEDYTMEVTGTFSRPVVRQSQEGTMLANAIRARDLGVDMKLLNSRMEFHQAGLINPRFGRLFD